MIGQSYAIIRSFKLKMIEKSTAAWYDRHIFLKGVEFMNYTDLVFDLYGTLVDIHTDENAAAWEKTALYFGYYGAHYTGESLKADHSSVMTKLESAAGQSYEMYPDIPFDEVLAELFRRKGIHDRADELGLQAAQIFRVTSTEYIRLYNGVLEALAAFRSKGYRLWLLSNAQRAFTEYELRHLCLGPQFDKVYLSSDYRCRKPDLRFFEVLLKDQRLDPSKCLMIGNDRETDIAGASAAGMSTLYMHTNLTPSHQAAAMPERFPDSGTGRKHYEFEGSNWDELTRFICSL